MVAELEFWGLCGSGKMQKDGVKLQCSARMENSFRVSFLLRAREWIGDVSIMREIVWIRLI